MTYIDIYTRAYTSHNRYKGKDMDAWIREEIRCMRKRRDCLRRRRLFVKHLLRGIGTQSLFKTVSTATREQLIWDDKRMDRVANFRIRRLQESIARHLWKPGGRLMLKHVPTDLLTQTT